MRAQSFTVVIFSVVFLFGCASQSGEFSYRESSFAGLLGSTKHQSRRSWVLSGHASILVAPFPASHLTDNQRKRLQDSLVNELGKGFYHVAGASKGSLLEAQQGQYHYLLVPTLTDSFDGLTGLPELLDNPEPALIGPDSLSLKLALYNVPVSALIDVTLVDVQSALITLDDQSPTSLASGAFEMYARRLNAIPHP